MTIPANSARATLNYVPSDSDYSDHEDMPPPLPVVSQIQAVVGPFPANAFAATVFARLPVGLLGGLSGTPLGPVVGLLLGNLAVRTVSNLAAMSADGANAARRAWVNSLVPVSAALLSSVVAAEWGGSPLDAAFIGHEVCEALIGVANMLEPGVGTVVVDAVDRVLG
jgi:hypothetical protein